MLTEEQVSIIRQADKNIVELLEKKKNTQSTDAKIVDKQNGLGLSKVDVIGLIIGFIVMSITLYLLFTFFPNFPELIRLH